MPAQDGAEEGGGEEGCAENHLLRDIFENYCLFHRRETWDPSIATQRELRRWEGGYSCVAYTTGAAAGGAIGPRLMVDVRVHQSEKLPFENCSTNSADFDDEALHGLGEGGRKQCGQPTSRGGVHFGAGRGGGLRGARAVPLLHAGPDRSRGLAAGRPREQRLGGGLPGHPGGQASRRRGCRWAGGALARGDVGRECGLRALRGRAHGRVSGTECQRVAPWGSL